MPDSSSDKHPIHSLDKERKRLEMEWERRRGKGEGRKEKNTELYLKKKWLKIKSTTGIWKPRMYYQSRCKVRPLKAIFAHHSLSNSPLTLPPKINWVERGHAPIKQEKHRCVGRILKKRLCLSNKY